MLHQPCERPVLSLRVFSDLNQHDEIREAVIRQLRSRPRTFLHGGESMDMFMFLLLFLAFSPCSSA